MRYAILVACEEYENFPTISFCYADAEEIRSTLIDYCDYSDKNLIYEQPFTEEDTPDKIYGLISNLAPRIHEEDTLLFYFAGHGYKAEEKGFLLLPKSKIDDLPNTALDIKILNEKLQKTGCNCFLILDACHSGIQARSVLDSTSIIDTISKDAGCVTIAACSANEESHPAAEFEHGVFTYYLCQAIRKAHIRENILPENLKMSVCTAVSNWAQKHFTIQTPTLIGQVVGNISIATRNEKPFDNTEEIVEDETLTLLEDVVKNWMFTKYELNIEKSLPINKDWKAFGKYKTFEATNKEKEKLMVLFTIVEKYNHSNLIHAFSNLHRIKEYYSKLGVASKDKYMQLIILKNKEACHCIDRPLNVDKSIQKLFRDQSIHSLVLYLSKGNLVEYLNNITDSSESKV